MNSTNANCCCSPGLHGWALPGPGPEPGAQGFTTPTRPGYPTVAAVESMGKKLEAATSGRIKLQMFPGAVLGQEKEVVEQTQLGAIQIARISLGVIGPVVPEVNVFNMPFVFRNEAHMRAVIDGPIGSELLDKVSASPAKLVALDGWTAARAACTPRRRSLPRLTSRA
jgi:TRAP-type C4-dicarboxylate transport system substrate-binding protein